MEKVRKVLLVILLLVALISGVLVLQDYLSRAKEEKEYERLAEIVQTTEESTEELTEEQEPEEERYISPIDFETLTSMNSDTIGWIQVPDTPIDYPIVQCEDNEKYLHTDFNGEPSIGGTIFLDFESSPDLKGKNNILYGHHMKNGSMFKALVAYKDEKYFQEHPYFTIYTPDEEIHLRVIAAYYGVADPETRRTRFSTEGSYQEFIERMTSKCSYRVELEGEIEALYTLITCSYEFNDARTFVFAVPIDEEGNIIYKEEASEKIDESLEETSKEQQGAESNLQEADGEGEQP
ncbi:class B sortase [Lachnospiraceae bacterium 62-35]